MLLGHISEETGKALQLDTEKAKSFRGITYIHMCTRRSDAVSCFYATQ